jgi:TPR repeat protein
MVINANNAFDNMTKAAQQNHPLALHGLGFMYYEGECAEQDYKQAMMWFEKAAEQGLTGSMMTISSMYTEGQGVAQDDAKAKEWMDKAMAA